MLTNHVTKCLDEEQQARYDAWQANDRTPNLERETGNSAGWRWGWSWWIGIHYGPIPVGLLLVGPLLAALNAG